MDLSEAKKLLKQAAMELNKCNERLREKLFRTRTNFDPGEVNDEQMAVFQDTPSCGVAVFTNSLIMARVTNHLPEQDLRRCRLVCKLWAREMGEYLKERKSLVVADEEDFIEAKRLVQQKEEGKMVNIRRLLILDVCIKSPIILNVIKNFGKTLSYFELSNLSPQLNDLSLYGLLKSMPNLEMKVSASIDWEEGSYLDKVSQCSPQLVMSSVKTLKWEEDKPLRLFDRFVTMFPNLEELDLFCWLKPKAKTCEGLQMNNLKQLTTSCDDQFDYNHFQALASLKLKLERLTLVNVRPVGNRKMKAVKKFLKSISETITEMSLNACQDIIMAAERVIGQGEGSVFLLSIPPFQNLPFDPCLFNDLKFIDFMPNLTELKCSFQDSMGWSCLLDKNGLPTKSHSKLRELWLGAIDGDSLLRMMPTFNTVVKLDVFEDRIDDVAFRNICVTMPQLEHLTIRQNDLIEIEESEKIAMTDAGITGIPPENTTELMSNLPQKLMDDSVQKIREFAYVGSLKNLCGLELEMSSMNLTELGILYGIADLESLESITLPNCSALGAMSNLRKLRLHKDCGLSAQAVEELQQKIKDLTLNLY